MAMKHMQVVSYPETLDEETQALGLACPTVAKDEGPLLLDEHGSVFFKVRSLGGGLALYALRENGDEH